MRPWPRWSVLVLGLLVGFVLGWLVTIAVVRGLAGLQTPAWQEGVAWQGWVGAVIGALSSAAVALVVLFVTLGHSSRNVDRQLAHQEDQFRQQMDAAEAAWRTQESAANERFRAQIVADRHSANEQSKLTAWAELIAALRQFIEFPVAEPDFREIEQQAASALVRWRLYLPLDESVLGDGAQHVLGKVIGDSKRRASHLRRTAQGSAAVPVNSQIDEVVDLIVELQQRYERWYRDEGGRADATAWFAHWSRS